MYLERIYCENMGPISKVDFNPRFTDGCPVPIILVGENGSGKSMLISSIVDSLYEISDQAFTDMTHKLSEGGHKYFKMKSSSQIKLGEKNLLCYLKFKEGNEKIEYTYHMGNFNKDDISRKLKDCSCSFAQDSKSCTKGKREIIKNTFEDGAYVYFPPERFYVPFWMVNEYAPLKLTMKIDTRYLQELGKPILATFVTKENINWVLDVFVDSKAQLMFDQAAEHIPMRWNQNDYKSSYITKQNIEKIFSLILKDDVELILLTRNAGGGRFTLCRKNESFKKVIPKLEALSTGQTLLLDMFLTIIRYGEYNQIKKSNQLNEITGIVVIDEAELHLHSDLQYEIFPKLVSLFPKVQFIITSHSPLLLLGMRKNFNELDVIEMPTGEKIDPEDFSEFEKSYDAMFKTKRCQKEIDARIQQKIADGAKTLIITEGKTDWKHLKRAWNKLKNDMHYQDIKDEFEFYEHDETLGIDELVRVCKFIAKINEKRMLIFIADADVPKKSECLKGENGSFKNWGRNVFSFEIPKPSHREFNEVCIEHYYRDDELKTEKNVNGEPRRLFLCEEFDQRTGQTQDGIFFYENHKGLKNLGAHSLIDGSTQHRVTKLNDHSNDPVNYALSKNSFADSILNEDEGFSNISSESFRLIFDIIKEIIKVPNE